MQDGFFNAMTWNLSIRNFRRTVGHQVLSRAAVVIKFVNSTHSVRMRNDMKHETKRSGIGSAVLAGVRRIGWFIPVAISVVSAAPAVAQNPGYIYTANETLNVVDVLRASDHVVIASMPTISTPYGVAATQDGKRVYVSTFDGKNIYAFDAETNALISTLQFGSELREITLTPDDKYLYVPDYNENVVHIVSTGNNTLKGDIPVGANPHMVAFGDGGKYAYVTAEGGQVVTVIDTRTATVVANIPVGETPIGIVASPDGRTIYVANYGASEVSFISVKTQTVVATVSLAGNAKAVTVSPDGKLLYAVCENPSKGYVISVENHTVVADFSVGSGPRNVTVDPDGKTIYVASFESLNLYAINAETYRVDYTKALGALDGIAFSSTVRPAIENYTFKTLDYPGAIKTEVHQINENGYAVGFYVDKATVQHGFLYHKGEFVNYDFPGANSTQLNDINSSNLAVGSFAYPQGGGGGFQLFDGVGGIINLNLEQDGQSLTVPSGGADGIDDDGTVVGSYYNPIVFANRGYRLDGFSVEDLANPGPVYVEADGVAGNLIVGWFIDSENNFHGLRWKSDEYSQFDFPGAGTDPNGSIGFTFAFKVNEQKDIVGSWGRDLSNTQSPHSFLIEGKTQREISFDYPNAISTSSHGINIKGQITGSYIDTNSVMHGFIATPVPDECDHKK
jgi:YVTN family beta-propeller protein